MARFDGKVAIVTGGARGIGAAIVARLASEGAKVMIADVNAPAETGEHVAFLKTDATVAADVQAVVAATLDRWGRLDILVNNAGIGALVETPEMAEEVWDRVFAINTRAIFLFCKAAIPAIREAGGGAIVNIASISGLLGDYAMGAYNASKGAVVNYTRSLALDCGRDGIRVNALCPGLIETEMARAAVADPLDRAFWFDRIPLGRSGTPEEMAAVAAFLASDDASYLTGVILAADGGITAHSGQPNAPQRIRERTRRQG
ncbi:SDR family oxidoreductase [Novosphingobium sp. G106]|uniref:SDR family NAD(P)-dependent oxidoreductase n=1 Tax=Novosphingobium sp. G106 TaxID=2849500 RepID=UPI001C2D3308|nr:SDR family oxidoreductase [Novosphingobium sp. G106]MBV1686159.1 SDR family oxidoreductase [Novosphingobium sp. G106]